MRFVNVGGELTLQAKLGDEWEHIYRVIPDPEVRQRIRDRELVYGHTRMRPYQSNIVVALPEPNRTRITMFNRRVTVRNAAGDADRRRLKDEAEFTSALRREFGLNLTDEEIRACIDVMERKGEKGAPHPSLRDQPRCEK